MDIFRIMLHHGWFSRETSVCVTRNGFYIWTVQKFIKFNYFQFLAHLADSSSELFWSSVRPSFCKLFIYSSSSPELLVQFQPTWHIIVFSKWDSRLFKQRATLFSKGKWQRTSEHVLCYQHLKILFFRTTRPISTILGTQTFLGDGNSIFFFIFHSDVKLKTFFYRTFGPILTKLDTKHSWMFLQTKDHDFWVTWVILVTYFYGFYGLASGVVRCP